MQKNTQDTHEHDDVWDSALNFVMALHESPEDPQLRQNLARWLSEDPSHPEAYQQAEMIWALTGQVDAQYDLEAPAHEPVPDNAPTQAEVVSINSARPRSGKRLLHWIAPAAVAACLAWVMLPSLQVSQLLSPGHFNTAVGEQQTITLSDGSTTTLSTRTSMDTRFDAIERRVLLHSGEAFFRVTKDPNRPFTVATEWGDVTVVGTRFNVRAGLNQSLVVTVEEGIVDVRHPQSLKTRRLLAGDRLSLSSNGTATLSQVAIDQIASWRHQEIIVNDWTIGELIQELERYQPGVTTLLGDSLSEQRISGVFHLNDPLAAMTAAVAPLGGEVRSIGPITIVSL